MNRNSAPCTVPNMRSWGVRKNWRMVRFALCRAAVMKSAPVPGAIVGSIAVPTRVSMVVMGDSGSCGGVGRGGLRVGVGRCETRAGDGAEHLIGARGAG